MTAQTPAPWTDGTDGAGMPDPSELFGDTFTADDRAMILTMFNMVSELHAAYSEVRPLLEQMMNDLQTQGVAGIMSAAMGAMLRPGGR